MHVCAYHFGMSKSEETMLLRVGKALREARVAAGLTQAAAAEIAGVTREYWAHVEGQGRNLTLVTLARLAWAVNASLSEIVLAAGDDREPAVSLYREFKRLIPEWTLHDVKRLRTVMTEISGRRG